MRRLESAMRPNPSDDELLRGYLLGELPEPEADRLEQRLLADDELFDLLEGLEAELLAAASRGELAPAERDRVLRRLASSPRGRERLALARSLNAIADSQAAARTVVPFRRREAVAGKRGFQWAALAAAGLIATAGLSWFALQRPQEGSSGSLVAHERPAPASPAVPATKEKATPPPAGAPAAPATPEPRPAPDQVARGGEPAAQPLKPIRKAVLALALTTLRGGGDEIEKLRLEPGVEVAEIQLDLEGLEASGPFHASVRSDDKGTIWEADDLKGRRLEWGMALVLDVPADLLTPGRYVVAVQAETETEPMTQEFEVVPGDR